MQVTIGYVQYQASSQRLQARVCTQLELGIACNELCSNRQKNELTHIANSPLMQSHKVKETALPDLCDMQLPTLRTSEINLIGWFNLPHRLQLPLVMNSVHKICHHSTTCNYSSHNLSCAKVTEATKLEVCKSVKLLVATTHAIAILFRVR